MKLLLFLSNLMIPLLVFAIVAYGLYRKKSVYDEFVEGTKEGMKTVVGILPTLIGLMLAVGILRASGALDRLSILLQPLAMKLHFPAELLPLSLVKMISSSAATGLLLDIFKEYGPDSHHGILASVMMSCSETIFYTMSVYFLATKVKKTRYTLVGALIATLGGIIASVILCGL